MLQKVIWGLTMSKICIFWGLNYLPHAASNTAAYECISVLQHIISFREGSSSFGHVIPSISRRRAPSFHVEAYYRAKNSDNKLSFYSHA